MTSRIVVAGVLVALAAAVAAVARRRAGTDPPSQPVSWTVPAQLDRRDFASPSAPWLVAVFSSATCDACAQMARKATVLASSAVAVDDVEFSARADIHRRYGIDAVPTVVIADAAGVVRRSFVGPVSATDLWAAVAEAREPGSVPPGGCGKH